MLRRREFALAGLSAATLAALGSANEKRPDPREAPEAMFEKCAKSCSDCQRACDACATYCGKVLAKGNAHHFDTLMACRDCADLCSTSASLTARQGPFADLTCRACAEACARCAAQCEQHGRDDAVMTRCAEECRRCETACREMLSHVVSER
jgi:hypothetical protein